MANVPQSKNDRGARWDNTQDTIARLAADDGVSQWEVQASNLYGWDSTNSIWRRVKVDATGTLAGGAAGGGGAATIADGADVTQGTTTDVAWTSGAGTVISLLKKIASAGGSAVSVADGSDVAQGTTTDLSSANTVIGILKAIKAAITGTLTVGTHAVTLASTTITGTVTADTELPAAAALTDTDANPTAPYTASALMGYNGTTWTRLRTGFGDGASATGLQNQVPMMFNGTTYDRFRGSAANGLTVLASQGTAGTAANGWPVKLTDGTNTSTVKAASTAAVAADTALVVALSPNNNTLANALITKPGDGTNTITVKAASTASAAADTALVVALSPNNNTLANSLITRLSDGTNIATVKAASGTVAATDLQLAVGLHPNSNPMKVWDGSNAISVKAASVPAAVTDTAAVVAISSWQTTKVLSAASNNANFSKASAGLVGGWYIYNAAATARYVRLFNKASAPTMGSDSPIMVIAVPAGAAANVEFTAGLVFSTGIAYAITAGIADLDNTSTAASDVIMNLYWK